MAPWGAEALPQKPGRSLLEYQMKNINTEEKTEHICESEKCEEKPLKNGLVCTGLVGVGCEM